MFNNNNNYNSRGVPEFMAYGGTPVGIPKGAVPQHATNGAVPTWSLGQQNQTSTFTQPTQLAQNNTQANNPNCYVEFDGKNVDLYRSGQYDGNRLHNGQLEYNLSGQSGQNGYQNRNSQNIPNKGPIPEGTYYADQNQRQTITPLQAGWGIIAPIANKILPKPKGTWNGSLPAWGTRRVWLRPDENTNTYGRSGFTIHGGWSKGSAGCIDIPWQTKQLSDFLDNCQDSVPVYVKYPKENW